MKFKSINPYNEEILNEFQEHTLTEINAILNQAEEGFKKWRATTFSSRAEIMKRVAALLVQNVDTYAKTITLEMGKPLMESKAEVKKCAWVCEYYAEEAEKMMALKTIKTDAFESYVTHEPMGCILAIMPWNFPFWQVFRFAAPALMGGNVGLLKHASNVFGCAVHIENIFKEAGAPLGAFQNLFLHHDKVEYLLAQDVVKAVTLTGSEIAGASVASIAGKNIKKSLLELGGSNAFVVLADADLDNAVSVGVNARMLNSGQSCIASKRFIVHESVYEEFVGKFTKIVSQLKAGDPIEEGTKIGTLARKDLADTLKKQVDESVQMGALIKIGGHQKNAFFEPTVLTNITRDMPVFKEETFGPVAPIMKFKNIDEAFELANDSQFGLGVSVFTKDLDKLKPYISKINDGAFFVNDLVKSDPRLPFGGTKKSGYGRELSQEGILEFVNVKTVYIKKG
ncbi:MAG: NAD-dependent succinate-semialdehyde dehydrogenase [Saprospiraceae bacterium]